MDRSSTSGVEVQSQLEGELSRMRRSTPDGVLNVAPNAGRAAVRAAYLAMVKRYHPHRFVRHGSEVEELANEIFLLVKDAYDLLTQDAARRRVKKSTAPPPRARRPSASVTFRKRSGSRPTRPPSPSPIPRVPQRVPLTGRHTELVAELEEREQRHGESFRAARALLEAGQFGEAGRRFRELAAANPSHRPYRVHMHYAWACEHEAAGRVGEAIAELKRALTIDGGFEPACNALTRLESQQQRPGFFSRLFRRDR